MTADRQKAALLAEPVAAGSAVKRIAVRGFQEGERIAKVQDLTVQCVTGTSMTVKPFDSDAVGFPRGSVVMTFDGTRSTRLQRDIPPSRARETTIEVEEPSFASDLKSGDVLKFQRASASQRCKTSPCNPSQAHASPWRRLTATLSASHSAAWS